MSGEAWQVTYYVTHSGGVMAQTVPVWRWFDSEEEAKEFAASAHQRHTSEHTAVDSVVLTGPNGLRVTYEP